MTNSTDTQSDPAQAIRNFGLAMLATFPNRAAHSDVVDRLAARGRRWQGLSVCCGTTNAPCARPPGIVCETLTGCETCGHPKTCHAKTWA